MPETAISGTLNDREACVVSRTVAGESVERIADALEISVFTVYRLRRLPHVRLALTEARAAEVRPLVAQALGEVEKSVQTLAAIRDSDFTRNGDRIRASTAILDWFTKVWEVAEVMPRLAALEAQLAPSADSDTPPGHTINTTSVRPTAVPPGMVADDDTDLA